MVCAHQARAVRASPHITEVAPTMTSTRGMRQWGRPEITPNTGPSAMVTTKGRAVA